MQISACVIDPGEIMSMPKKPQKHCLQHIFRVRSVSGDTKCRPKYPVVMRQENLLEVLRSVSHGDSLYRRLCSRHPHTKSVARG